MPKVSVIIPSYNSAQYIGEAIESVFAQTYRDFEIIVVDDGSIDDTKEVLSPYINRIVYLFQVNGGVAKARNAGIRNAQGEYIAFLDADDVWFSEKLELQMKHLDSYPDAVLVYSDYSAFDNNGKALRKRKKEKYAGNIFYQLIKENFIPTSTVVMKKEYFNKIGSFDESIEIAEDWDLWLRIARRYSICYFDKPLMKYKIHNDNMTNNIYKMLKNELLVLDKLFSGRVLSNKEQWLRSMSISNIYHQAGESYYVRRELSKAKINLLYSLNYFPFCLNAYYTLVKCLLGIVILTKLKIFWQVLSRRKKKEKY